MTLAHILDMIFPDVEDRESLAATAQGIVDGDVPIQLSDVRRLLGGLDRQAFPSPVEVRFRPSDVVMAETPRGTICLDPADASVSGAILQGAYEPHVSAIIERYGAPGMTVLDVGANVGFHTMAMARLVGSDGRVFAFEPNSENCRLILKTLSANSMSNVELLPVALGERRGWTHFTSHVGSNGGTIRSSDGHYVDGAGPVVAIWPLDELNLTRVGLIKLDVEGAEGLVVRGGEKTIRQSRPVIITELSRDMLRRVSQIDPLDYLSWYASLGYRIHVIDKASPGTLSPARPPQELLASWDDEFRIEDLLLDPGDRR